MSIETNKIERSSKRSKSGKNLEISDHSICKDRKEKRLGDVKQKDYLTKGKTKKVKSETFSNISISSDNDNTLHSTGAKIKVTCDGYPDGVPFKPVELIGPELFHPSLKILISKFTKPTPIQSYSWPILLEGRDLIGVAETGSGKTLAFSMPILSKILSSRAGKTDRVKVLIVTPTRELAMQIFDVISTVMGKSAICIYGGSSRFEQQKQINLNNPSVVVGTPGRLVDFLHDGTLVLGQVEYFVLDEADRMLDLGFEPDIREIVTAMKEEGELKRQTIMFSATWPTCIQTMAAKYLKDPVKIKINNAEDGEPEPSGGQKASNKVHQIVQVVKDPYARDPILVELLRKYHSSRTNRIIIFILYKKEADRLERLLSRQGFSCTSIHGDKSQRDRTSALNSFKTGQIPLLIATDVAARGLDIPQVEYIINFTFPLTIEDYIHRIGRTGRGGSFGTAHTFFTDADKALSGELINVLKASSNVAEIPQDLLNYGTTTKKKVHREYGAFFKEIDVNAKANHVKFDDE